MTHHTARVPATAHRSVELELRTTDLPDGICGRVMGIALTYGVADAYGTMFGPGCLARTKAEKLAAGKVKLLADHEGVTGCHVGVVRTLETVGDSELMSADIFDTAAGRDALEYVKAVVAAKAFTGLSIGFYDRKSEWVKSDTPVETAWGTTRDSVLVYTECELDEVSLTPSPAVPGAEVTGTRRTSDKREILRKAFGTIVDQLPDDEVRQLFVAKYGEPPTKEGSTGTSEPRAHTARAGDKQQKSTSTSTTAADDASKVDSSGAPAKQATPPATPSNAPVEDRNAAATMDERIRAVRQSYRIH
jgi:HK97 family phage prohead protease